MLHAYTRDIYTYLNLQPSKKSNSEYYGRIDANIKVIVPRVPIPINHTDYNGQSCNETKTLEPGDFIVAKITESNSQSLKGIPLYHSTISTYAANSI